MPYRPSQLARIERAKAFYAEVMAVTVCAHCGAQPVDWHSPDHALGLRRRVNKMVSVGFAVEKIAAEMAKCAPLCRHCHMQEDGRLARLQQNGIAAGQRRRVGLRPCKTCDRPTDSHSMHFGNCSRCHAQLRLAALPPDARCHAGVRRLPSGHWTAYLTRCRRQRSLGTYKTFADAVSAYEQAVRLDPPQTRWSRRKKSAQHIHG